MGKVVTSIVVEYARFTVLAPGAVSLPTCQTDPVDCCDGSGSGSGCCYGSGSSPPDALAVAFDGPLLPSCTGTTVSGTLERIGDVGLLYTLAPPIDLGHGGFIVATLYCVGIEWRLNGTIKIAGADDSVFFDIPMDLFPDLGLVGSIVIPGCDNTVTVAVGINCFTWDCVGSGCEPVAGFDGKYQTLDDCLALCGTVPCCPDDPLPTTLKAVITGGSCPDTYSLIFGSHSVSDGWASELCPVAGPVGSLRCVGLDWLWNDNAGSGDVAPDSFDCSVPTWTFTVPVSGIGSYTVVITAP